MCGCGERTALAPATVRSLGRVKGQPIKFISGHQNRTPANWPPINPECICECGCGEKTTSPRHRFVRGHQRRKSAVEYIVDPVTGCHVWQRACLKSGGYGVKRVDGKLVRVHRLNYEQKYGPIPEGLVPHHTCENPPCGNPEHIELKTNAGNTRLGRQAKLTEETVAQIREMAEMGATPADLAAEFGVHKGTIRSVLSGKSWSNP
jgi:hypothetical protein